MLERTDIFAEIEIKSDEPDLDDSNYIGILSEIDGEDYFYLFSRLLLMEREKCNFSKNCYLIWRLFIYPTLQALIQEEQVPSVNYKITIR